MSEDQFPGRPPVPEPGGWQSPNSAADDELAETIELHSATGGYGAPLSPSSDAAGGPPPASPGTAGQPPGTPGQPPGTPGQPPGTAGQPFGTAGQPAGSPPAPTWGPSSGPPPSVRPAGADETPGIPPSAPQPGRSERRPGGGIDPSRYEAFARGDSGGPGGGGPADGGVPLPSGRRAARRRVEKMTRRRRKAPWWELPLLVGFAILIAVLVKSFVVQPFYIPSESMEKTLHGCPGCKGDRILVNKPVYDLRDPHPGDIVVFNAPPGWDDEVAPTPPSNPVLRAVRGFGQLVGVVPPDGLVLVKRVIAVGGQTVKGDSEGRVMVSDSGRGGPYRTLTEPYVFTDGPDSHAQFGPVTIPQGRLWVMGDHRNDSADSRFHCGSGGAEGPDGPTCDATSATVPDNLVIGKAVVIAWPPSRWRTLGTPKTFTSAAGALGPALPPVGAALTVLPVWFVRRRRR